jgi:hypothetical protein
MAMFAGSESRTTSRNSGNDPSSGRILPNSPILAIDWRHGCREGAATSDFCPGVAASSVSDPNFTALKQRLNSISISELLLLWPYTRRGQRVVIEERIREQKLFHWRVLKKPQLGLVVTTLVVL